MGFLGLGLVIGKIALGKDITRVDMRKNYIGEDFLDISIKLLTLLKPAWYLGAVAFIGVGIGSLLSN
jgi:hypothetical protein